MRELVPAIGRDASAGQGQASRPCVRPCWVVDLGAGAAQSASLASGERFPRLRAWSLVLDGSHVVPGVTRFQAHTNECVRITSRSSSPTFVPVSATEGLDTAVPHRADPRVHELCQRHQVRLGGVL